jgi:hypothetical protein
MTLLVAKSSSRSWKIEIHKKGGRTVFFVLEGKKEKEEMREKRKSKR